MRLLAVKGYTRERAKWAKKQMDVPRDTIPDGTPNATSTEARREPSEGQPNEGPQS
jgi:hypothetical protein